MRKDTRRAKPAAGSAMAVTLARFTQMMAALLLAWGLSACGGGSEEETHSEAAAAQQKPGAPLAVPKPETAVAAPVQVNLSPSDELFPNPERGFYVWAADHLLRWTSDDAASQHAKGHRLVYAVVRLDAYRTQNLSEQLLQDIHARMAIARQHGLKLILRFAYNYPGAGADYTKAKDATLTQVLAHIAQLRPVLRSNADVIAYLQAGFIGAWGEWHSSSNNLTEPAARTAIRRALLAAMPATHSVQFRYPPHLMAWSPSPPTAADTSLAARSGFHNDCFLASTTDVGTYSEAAATRAQERAWVTALGDVAPFGGETCTPDTGARLECQDIQAEGASLNLTYLNEGYHEDFIANWKTQGCYATVDRKMGYRFTFESVTHPASVARGQSLSVQAALRNDGWSRSHLPRRFQLLLVNKSSGREFRLNVANVNPRDWRPQVRSTPQGTVTVPRTVPAGNYDVYLALPDGAATLANLPRYAIRPANANNAAKGQSWDASKGAFKLGSTLAVTL